MEANIEVLQPGLFSSIQDGGRFGYRQFGVPESGPMDTPSASMANLLLQQDNEAAVMEITQQGPKLLFSDATEIVITGALLSPSVENKEIRNNRVYRIEKGQVLSFGKRKMGCRAYLGIKGGFQTEKVLNSRSWSPGVTTHSRLEKGMKLPFLAGVTKGTLQNSSVRAGFETTSEIVPSYPGPEYDMLTASEKNMLQNCLFSIGRNSNRMGIQFEEILKNELEPIITGPVLPGTVQLTPSGKVIALMRDCQTTGGYPRILQLSEAGMNVLAQKIPGESFQIKLIGY